MKHITILFSLIILLINQNVFAASAVISANGFQCSSGGSSATVTCQGSFPNHPYPIISFFGIDKVAVATIYQNFVWTYDSHTGCLCKKSLGANKIAAILCTSRTGVKKTFNDSPEIYVPWCENN